VSHRVRNGAENCSPESAGKRRTPVEEDLQHPGELVRQVLGEDRGVTGVSPRFDLLSGSLDDPDWYGCPDR